MPDKSVPAKINRVILIDVDCRGAEHEVVNAAFSEAVLASAEESEIVLVAKPDHLSHVCAKMRNSDGIEKIEIYDGAGIYKYISLIGKLIKLVVFGSEVNGIVFLSCSVRTFVFINFVSLILRNINILVIFHGVLEKLENETSSGSIGDRIFIRIFGRPFSSKIKYGVLGDSIKKNLILIRPELENRIVSIDLPYIFSKNKLDLSDPFKNGKIVFGHLGYGHAAKGFCTFIDLAERICFYHDREKSSRFIAVGGIDQSDSRISSSKAVAYASNTWPVPRDKYEELLESITYAVFTYPMDSYLLRASGAVFDAISSCKPIICLRTPYFEYIFSILGDVGYICNSYSEIESLCLSLIDSFPSDRYFDQVNTLFQSRSIFEPHSIAMQLNERFPCLHGN